MIFHRLHIPSGRISEDTFPCNEHGFFAAHPNRPFPYERLTEEVALRAINYWNMIGGTTWKYWL
jgi:hypothetical protein